MIDLFGNNITPGQLLKANKKERKSEAAYKLMLRLFGKKEGQKCRGCKHFYYKVSAKKYPKCALSGCRGGSASSDWSGKWEACGKYEAKEKPAK